MLVRSVRSERDLDARGDERDKSRVGSQTSGVMSGDAAWVPVYLTGIITLRWPTGIGSIQAARSLSLEAHPYIVPEANLIPRHRRFDFLCQRMCKVMLMGGASLGLLPYQFGC